MQQNLDAQVSFCTNLHIIFRIDIYRNTHAYHMYTYISRSQPVTIWIQLQNRTRAILSKLAQGRQRCSYVLYKSPSTRRGLFFWHRRKTKKKAKKTALCEESFLNKIQLKPQILKDLLLQWLKMFTIWKMKKQFFFSFLNIECKRWNKYNPKMCQDLKIRTSIGAVPFAKREN